ncbi:MAG: hypothetical protein LBD14_03370, partial [Puniceicoccales bacterium]|nr:hypothetical protein [Puniceicoccales bacterium]
MTAFIPNATANTESSDLDGTLSRLRLERGASNYGVRECVSARDFAGLRPVPPAAGGSANNASGYGVRDFSPAFGAGDLSPVSLSGTGAEEFSETSSDGAFFADKASIPHAAINRLRESGDESPHSITGRVV